MIVEDEWIITEDLRLTLIDMGYDVSSMVNKGEFVIDEIKKNKPNLILMDINLGGELDGIETASMVRELFNIPIIYLSALSDDSHIKRVKSTAPFGYLTKPFNENELKINIEIALFKHDLEMKLAESEEKFRILADFMLDWEFWYHPDKGFIYVSPSCETITGYNSKEFYSNPDILKKIIYEEDWKKWSKIFSDKESIDKSDLIEFKIRTKNGDIRWIERGCNNITNNKGEYLGIRCSNRDITPRKKAQIEVKTLQGLLPICSSCKKIRDKQGNWHTLETYINKHSEAKFTHGICPDCLKKLYPDLSSDDT